MGLVATLTALATLAATCAGLTQSEYVHALHKLGFRHVDITSSRASTSSCSQACTSLLRLLPNSAFNSSDHRYAKEGQSYWSAIQGEQTPDCYVHPNTAQQVSGAVLTAEFYNCTFTVRSGGHAAFAGASNIDDGFTIDLKNLNTIKVSDDKTVTSLGTGNRWIDVYQALDRKGLSVIGGRVADIGVGGLTLGGGISFFSPRYGWACDNVINYQVVLGGGKILEVNQTSYPDLYFALRGGGNNFGIVTRMDVNTFPQGKMWGGMVTYDISKSDDLLTAFRKFAYDAPRDVDAAVYQAYAYYQGEFFISNEYTYAKPEPYPPIFSDFKAIPSTNDTTAIQSLSNITLAIKEFNPSGLRETYTTATFAMNAALLLQIVRIFKHETQKLAHVQDLVAAVTLQPITYSTIEAMSQRGGNPLPLTTDDAPLLLIDLSFMWTSPADDTLVIFKANQIRRKCVDFARGFGLYNKYIYQNYASRNQQVIASYGDKNVETLIATSKKYDPKQYFQKLVPGYFKLPVA